MGNVFEKPEDLGEYLFRIVDNGGNSADRLIVAFSDGSYLAMSYDPTGPQGFSQSGEGIDPATMATWVEEGEVVDLALGDLPEHMVQHILYRENEGLRDFLEAVEAKDPKQVARSRGKAKINYGLQDSLGDGIYLSGDKFMVRVDGATSDDRGPFDTAREAVLATLPDIHGFSGPEYHSSVDVCRMTPDPTVSEALKALEERQAAADAEFQQKMERQKNAPSWALEG